MQKEKIIKIKSFKKKGGLLFALDFQKTFPFKIKRIFYIYGRKNLIRGDHAHKKCSQVFFAVKGKIKINMKYKNINKNIVLNSNKAKALFVPPKIWSSVNFLENKSVVLVLADYEYDFKDYIETYKEFLAFQKKNK